MNTLPASLKISLMISLAILCTPYPASAALWVTGYYPGYKQCDDTQAAGTATSCDPGNTGRQTLMPPSAIDFTTLTHIIHFAVVPGVNTQTGEPELDENQLSITPGYSEQLIKAAHAANRKVLLSVGGAGTGDGFYNAKPISQRVQGGFRAATDSPEKIEKLVDALLTLMTNRHYDGIDVDWEPLCAPSNRSPCKPDDTKAYTALIKQLRTKLNEQVPHCSRDPKQQRPCPLLTTAIEKNVATLINPLQDYFDQINAMTYDMGSAWFPDNWMTWFNSPLYNTRAFVTNQSYKLMLPSADSMIKELTDYQPSDSASKISSTKLGLGIPFYGHAWVGGENLTCDHDNCTKTGARHPRQAWNSKQANKPVYEGEQQDFAKIMTSTDGHGFTPQNVYWDYDTEASYLSLEKSSTGQDRFVSYDDEGAVERKIRYAQSHQLGGVMIWELHAGFLPTSATNTTRQPLIAAIRAALNNTQSPTVVVYNNGHTDWNNAAIKASVNTQAKIKTPAAGDLAMKVTTSSINGGLNLTLNPSDVMLHPARIEKITFSLYSPGNKSLFDTLAIKLANPWGDKFPNVKLTSAQLTPINNFKGWYSAEVPIKTLNPWGKQFNGVTLSNLLPEGVENSFYMDNISFQGR